MLFDLNLFEENVLVRSHCIIYENKLIHKRCILDVLLVQKHVQTQQDSVEVITGIEIITCQMMLVVMGVHRHLIKTH